MNIPKSYDVKKAEKKWQEYWEKEGIYKFDAKSKKKIYSIDTPPPTVSGKMHMGHAFGNSQQDFVARYKRMKGFNVLQPFGTDDNGLPTKLLIEKEKKVNASSMSREEFVKLCLKTLKEELRPRYIRDWKVLGISCDFDVFYTTINKHCRRVSQKSFIELYKQGRQYRKDSPALWCTKCQTTIAQVELEDKEFDSQFSDIVFKSEDGKELVVATTRPEFLPATVALFFHPDDKRYKKLKGKKARVPLFDYEVPIMTDKNCDPEKGSGLMMVCTFGDGDDVEKYMEHKLPLRDLITKDGKLKDIAGKYAGKGIIEARKEILKELKEKNLLVKQKLVRHAVNVHERCGTEIEFIKTKQWFVKYLDLRKDMLRWGEELKWFPNHMKNRYDNWVKGLKWDWCISRQLPFGIPFPVWYCKECDEVIVAKEKDLPVDPLSDKPPVKKCPKCGCSEFVGEKDIINTWATSSLTPTIVKELFKGKPVYDYLIKNPMDLRPQGHDIITFWLFNTVLKSQLHFKMRPWNDCFINGWMLDPKGKKMSKSKGNIVEPQEMIEKYSADALRFMASNCKLGEDFPFPEKDIVTGSKTITKLWNASRFVLMHLEGFDGKRPNKVKVMDRWLLSKLNRLVKVCTESFEQYEFSKSKAEVDKFFWQDFCTNYLEISKNRLYNLENEGARKSAQYALYYSLLSILKLFAPIMPYITEEIYNLYYSKKENKKSIHVSAWPEFDKTMVDDEAEKTGDFVVYAVSRARRAKSEKKLSLKTPIKKMTLKGKITVEQFDKVKEDILGATNAEDVLFEHLGKDSKIDDVCEIEF